MKYLPSWCVCDCVCMCAWGGGGGGGGERCVTVDGEFL